MNPARLSIILGFLASTPAQADEGVSLRLKPTLAQPAAAAESMPPAFNRGWTVQVEPSAWFVAPSGRLRLPVEGGGAIGDEVKFERLNLDSTRLRPAGEVHINAEEFRFSFAGSTTSVEQDSVTADSGFRLGGVDVASGDAFSVDLDLTSIELSVGYLVYSRAFGSPEQNEIPGNAVRSDLFVYAVGGARFYDVSLAFERFGGAGQRTAGADEFFGEPMVGVRIEWEFARDFFLDAQVTGGALPLDGHSVYSLDIVAGFQWRPVANVGVQIGYRQLAYWLSDGEDAEEFSWEGRLAGLYAGVVLRF